MRATGFVLYVMFGLALMGLGIWLGTMAWDAPKESTFGPGAACIILFGFGSAIVCHNLDRMTQ